MKVIIQGIRTTQQGVLQLQAKAHLGAREAVALMGAALDAETKDALTRSGSHRRGTPTPSKPGDPPAIVTGTLRRGIRVDVVTPTGPNTFRTQVGPTVVYARIQELGGLTGRNRATRLPARPSLGPSNRKLLSSGRYEDIAIGAFRRALAI